jgi:hypothetical protein
MPPRAILDCMERIPFHMAPGGGVVPDRQSLDWARGIRHQGIPLVIHWKKRHSFNFPAFTGHSIMHSAFSSWHPAHIQIRIVMKTLALGRGRGETIQTEVWGSNRSVAITSLIREATQVVFHSAGYSFLADQDQSEISVKFHITPLGYLSLILSYEPVIYLLALFL